MVDYGTSIIRFMTLELSIFIPGNGRNCCPIYGPKFIGFGQMSVPGAVGIVQGNNSSDQKKREKL